MKSEQLIEAALFVSSDPISIQILSKISGLETEKIEKIVENLKKEYEGRESAVEIRKIGEDQYLMQVKDMFAAPLLDLVKPVVSQEVLKTLSLIALKQPITQAVVVKARGYSTYNHVKELVGKGFITAEPKGRTKLLATTKKFSDYFGFPAELEELKKEIARQLGKAPSEGTPSVTAKVPEEKPSEEKALEDFGEENLPEEETEAPEEPQEPQKQ